MYICAASRAGISNGLAHKVLASVQCDLATFKHFAVREFPLDKISNCAISLVLTTLVIHPRNWTWFTSSLISRLSPLRMGYQALFLLSGESLSGESSPVPVCLSVLVPLSLSLSLYPGLISSFVFN